MLQSRLWRHGVFFRFFVGASFSITGNWFNTVAIAVLTFQITGQVSAAAGALAFSVLPRAILGPLGGVIADAFERRASMFVIDMVRATISLTPLLVHDRSTLWLLYASVVLSQAASTFYGQRAYLPTLVPDDLLEGANAAVAILFDVGMVAVAGRLVSGDHPRGVCGVSRPAGGVVGDLGEVARTRAIEPHETAHARRIGIAERGGHLRPGACLDHRPAQFIHRADLRVGHRIERV